MSIVIPTLEDFKKYGRFHSVEDLDLYHELPLDILFYVFPNYIFSRDKIPRKMLDKLRLHCILCKRRADYEDKMQELNDQKELQLRRFEDKIKKHYSNEKR